MSNKNNTYKQTPVGLIPTEWNLKRIGDVISFSGGSQPNLKYFKYFETSGYIRLIQTRDYRTDKYKTYIPIGSVKKFCDENDIMIGRYGPPIFQVFKGLSGAYNVALIKATPVDFISKDYSYYFLCRPELRMYLEGLSQRSGGQTGVDIEKLNEYPFPIPTLHEQQKIAAILSTWDTAIDNCKTIIEKLKERNKGLAQHLLTGKVRVKGFGTSKWQSVPINTIAKEVSLKNPSDKELIVMSCTKYDGLVPSLEYFGRKIYSNDLTTYKIVKKGQFAYATNHIEEGSIGYQASFDEALISPMYTVFQTDDTVYDDLLFRILKSHTYIHEYQKRMEGSIDRRGGLRWDEFSKIKVPIVGLEEQRAIYAILETATAEINQYQQRLQALQLQKKGLMQQLLTGKTRVKI